MAESGKPVAGEVIHKADMDDFVTELNATTDTWEDTGGNDQKKTTWYTQKFGGFQSPRFTTISSLHEPAIAGMNGGDSALVQRKAVVDALSNYYTKSQLDTRFKQSYTVILPFSVRNNGTYTFSQSIDTFDAVEVLCSGYNGTEQFSYMVIRKEDYYISNSAGANFAIYYSTGGSTRRVMFSLTTTSIVCTSNEGPARLCRVRGIVY